jgi:hypothetical protein
MNSTVDLGLNKNIYYMKHWALMLLIPALFVACSKKEPAADESAALAADGTPVARPAKGNAQIAADLNQVTKNVQAQQYDSAVSTLMTLKEIPKSDQDERLYQQSLHQTSELLRQKAETDARARESYQVLGRAMTGR